MEQNLVSNYQDVFERIEVLEGRIESYQEFLGTVRKTYDECSTGCYERFRGGRVLEPNYIKSSHIELVEEDGFIESVLEERVNGQKVRELTSYCSDEIADMREERSRLLERRETLEREIGFYRHPKKEFES